MVEQATPSWRRLFLFKFSPLVKERQTPQPESRCNGSRDPPKGAWTPADGQSVGDAFLVAHSHLNDDRSVNPFGLFKV
jgi:hypothetical protein